MGAVSYKTACLRILHTSVQVPCLSLVLLVKQDEKSRGGT